MAYELPCTIFAKSKSGIVEMKYEHLLNKGSVAPNALAKGYHSVLTKINIGIKSLSISKHKKNKS